MIKTTLLIFFILSLALLVGCTSQQPPLVPVVNNNSTVVQVEPNQTITQPSTPVATGSIDDYNDTSNIDQALTELDKLEP